jgi:thiamine biosynthesis lipoprotein
VAVDAETDCLLDLVHEQWQRSEGLVDATSGVVRYAWDEGQFEAPHDSRELQHLMTCIGWNHVRRMPGWVRFEHPALELDLGSLHEAFAVDRAVAKVQAVEGVGVSLRVGHARRVAGTLRSSAARRPAAPLQTGSLDALLASWPLRTGGLVARGFAFDAGTEDSVGQLGFDPTTGRPLQTWHQMAVLAATAVEADTLVKTSLVKGANAVEWLNQQQACYYALRRDDKLFCSGLDAAMLAATPTGIAA